MLGAVHLIRTHGHELLSDLRGEAPDEQLERPTGNLVPDAHLAALMLEHGVATIVTRDRDFRRFRGLSIDDPFA